MDAGFHHGDGNEEGREGHEAEDADGPAEADLGEEAVEDYGVDYAWGLLGFCSIGKENWGRGESYLPCCFRLLQGRLQGQGGC